MKEILSIPFRDNLRRNRLLSVVVVLAFLMLAFCHIQTPKTDSNSPTIDKTLDTAGSNNPTIADSDSDSDGLSDELDACPDRPGAAIDNGCPIDSDGDGITDLDDKCPASSGEVDGCPEDRDKDGIIDSKDNCPDLAGPMTEHGCPSDSDGDGVSDALDQCPQTVGQISLDGCNYEPKNGDASSNAANEQRSLINQSQSAQTNEDNSDSSLRNTKTAITVEDADGDSVPDESDKCPERFGDASKEGCPPDSDNDGLADIDDRCPSIAGSTDTEGCLTISHSEGNTLDARDQQILNEAVAKVAFDSNSATLTTESRDLLNNVASLLQKYPTATLEIRGHTDASGVADNNMQLSMARASSVAAYIVSVGIDVNRLRAFGYGESQPIANNNYPEGRRINRRVEFELLFNE